VPENAANGKRREGCDHAIPEKARAPTGERWMPAELWDGLTGCFRFVALTLFVFLFERVQPAVVGHLAARDEERCERSIFADRGETEPGFGDGAAPGGIDEADGDVLALFDIPREVPGDGGEVLRGIG